MEEMVDIKPVTHSGVCTFRAQGEECGRARGGRAPRDQRKTQEGRGQEEDSSGL